MYSDFKTALDAYLVANWGHTPIYDYANAPGTPPAYDEWIGYRVAFMSDEVYAGSDGPHCVLANYGLEFSIFIGSAEGQSRAIALSELLKTLFLGKQLTSNMTFQTIDTEFGIKADNESSGRWYETRMFVSCEHRYNI